MVRHFLSNPVTYLILVVLGAGTITQLILLLTPGMLGDWLRTLAATFISSLTAVAIGVSLFNLQTKITDTQRTRQLILMLEAEICDVCTVLSNTAPHTLTPIKTNAGATKQAVLTEFHLIALDEAIRSGLFCPNDSMQLLYLAETVRMYNFKVRNLLSAMLFIEINDNIVVQLEAHRIGLIEDCRRVLGRLEELNI